MFSRHYICHQASWCPVRCSRGSLFFFPCFHLVSIKKSCIFEDGNAYNVHAQSSPTLRNLSLTLTCENAELRLLSNEIFPSSNTPTAPLITTSQHQIQPFESTPFSSILAFNSRLQHKVADPNHPQVSKNDGGNSSK
ncbi:hypothetical protein Droror1_Dr00009282 [Drosera rotundifolia]